LEFALERPCSGTVKDPASIPDTAQVENSAWRQLSLAAILRMMTAIGSVWLLSVFLNVPRLIPTFYGISMICVVVVLGIVAFVSVSDRIRFAVVEVGFLVAAINGILIYGMPPGVSVLLGLCVLLASIYHGARGGFIAGFVSMAVLSLGAFGWLKGYLPTSPHVAALVPTGHDLWIRAGFSQLMAVCGITGCVAHVTREMRLALERVRLAEKKFSSAFRVCPDALIISELETGLFIEVNDGHQKVSGYPRSEVIGRTSVDVGTFATVEDREAFAGPLRATGSLRRLQRKLRNKSGEWVDIVVSAECFDLGGVTCALSIIQDISEQKRTEAALKANEESFRSFIENAGVGIYRSTPDGKIVMANPALLRIMGFDSFAQMSARNLESEGYEPSYPRRLFREKIEREGIVNGWEAAWKRRDGTTMFVRESATVIRAQDGTIQFYDGIIEDISGRMKAEQELHESEDRFRTLTTAAFEGIVITENGRIIDINDQALELCGYSRNETIGREAIDFVSLESRALIAESMRSNSEASIEHDLLRKDGKKVRVEARAKMMQMGERVLRMTALHDVTERRQNDQNRKNLEEQVLQMQKMEALGTLAGGIAHDFNNILTGILGNLQIAEMDLPPDHPAFVALSSADKASQRARDLVARILSFSLPRRDNRNAASLGSVVLEAVELLSVGLPSGIEITTTVDPNCPEVECDPGQIHQVIMNLGTNSAHAMKGKGGAITIAVRAVTASPALCVRHPQVTPDHAVCLSLRDEGCGMPPAVLKRIFEPFYTTKDFGQGTGLGLAMVHTIMKSHNGAIVVESIPGVGTSFELYFPAAAKRIAAVDVVVTLPKRPGLVPFGRGRSVMLVDDEETVLSIGANLLRRIGFVVLAYPFPKEALKVFESDPAAISAVITDLTMPEMTGLELSCQILAKRPDMPIILTTGYLHSEAQKNARDSGIKCVVTKPFDVKEMISKIRLVLNEPEQAGP
jgi:two-component system cell cycle sensor histidine kinase/response regulator CckA